MRAFGIVAFAVCLSACASTERSEWPGYTREASQFERAWNERILGDEYLRIGSYEPMTDAWDMVSIIRQPDQTWLARRTEEGRDHHRVTITRSTACEALDHAIEELQHVTPPTMRALELNQAFGVVSDDPDVRLRIRTYFQEGNNPVLLTTMELRAGFGGPVFLWQGNLLRDTEHCWTPER